MSEEEKQCTVEDLMRLSCLPGVLDSSQWHQLTKLNLPNCNLTTLPSNLNEVLPNLSILFCPSNRFEELPPVIGSCLSLQMVSFKSNGMRRIHPDALQPQLRWLILTDNCLSTIPPEIGRCSLLQKLMLAGNQISTIPSEISNCSSLELVRLAANQLEESPLHLLRLPKLAWVALSENPFLSECYAKIESAKLKVLNDCEWNSHLDNDDSPILGQGASGTTRKGEYHGRPVAVKTYGSNMTSDGNPEHEHQLAALVGSFISDSPYLIQVLGCTPHGSLVMELLEDYTALAEPPSLQSCTRDVYRQDSKHYHWVSAPHKALIILEAMLSVLERLHAIGICHGDFYAHNILVAISIGIDDLPIKLSDFGAAFAYDPQSEYGPYIAQIEVRAFAVLVEEVATRIEVANSDADNESVARIKSLYTLSQSATSFSSLQRDWSHKV
jgi:Protein kinase domain/Leucine rich repeat